VISRIFTTAVMVGLVAVPVALGATGQGTIGGGTRNPSSNTSTGFSRETQIIGNIAQNQGGLAAHTGGYVTRQSNKSDTGGGAIYGCRAKAGTEACISANNLSNGDAFRFQASPTANTIGVLRFGLDLTKPVAKPPFVTNASGMVHNLNADMVDGKSADDFAPRTALTDYVAKNSLLFAKVEADGAIAGGRGVAANARAAVATAGADATFTIPMAADVSLCAYTASPTSAGSTGPLVVATGSDKSTVVVTEPGGATTPRGFHLQIVC
jgi:hypothetical protein